MRTINFARLMILSCIAASSLAQAQTLDELATRGAVVASADPLAVELRARAPNDSVRRGFDIGMAAAEGNTAPGPGKQRIHDSLPAAEQGGFDTAVSFSLQRNKNAKLAATGATIAQTDPVVAQARQADSDVFYWLGFDIGSGIFGDPALGALGNTATGPGSLGIRDALIPAAQRGFNASVNLHLHRNYKLVTSTVTPYGRADAAAHDRVYLDTRKPTLQASAFEELRCRGGAGIQFDLSSGRTNSSGEATNYGIVYFKPGTQAADSTGLHLQPGQCAYPDRALRDDEPNTMFLEIVYFGQTKQQLHGTPVDTSPTAAQRHPDAQNLPRYLADPKHYWSFYVRQTGPLPFGGFETSWVGRYWLPGLSSEYVVRPVDTRRAH
jgi:hypothetical protein